MLLAYLLLIIFNYSHLCHLQGHKSNNNRAFVSRKIEVGL